MLLCYVVELYISSVNARGNYLSEKQMGNWSVAN